MKRASKVARLWNSGPKHFEASFEAGLGLWKLEQNSIYIYHKEGSVFGPKKGRTSRRANMGLSGI